LIFRFLATWEIGFGEMAFEKLDFGKTDIRIKNFGKMNFGKLELGKMDFQGEKIPENGFRKIGFGILGGYPKKGLFYSYYEKFLKNQLKIIRVS